MDCSKDKINHPPPSLGKILEGVKVYGRLQFLWLSSWFHHHSVSIRDRILCSPCWTQTEGEVKKNPELVSDGTVDVQHHTRFDVLGVEPRTSCMLDKHTDCKCIPRPPHLWLLFSGVPNTSFYSRSRHTRDYVSPFFSLSPDYCQLLPFVSFLHPTLPAIIQRYLLLKHGLAISVSLQILNCCRLCYRSVSSFLCSCFGFYSRQWLTLYPRLLLSHPPFIENRFHLPHEMEVIPMLLGCCSGF